MYVHSDLRSVEAICYEREHIERVVNAIEQNFDEWFNKFIDSENGAGVSQEQFAMLKASLGVVDYGDKLKKKDKSSAYKRIIADAIDNFEKDREDYKKIFDLEALEEYEDDLNTFKSKVLRDKCPIIRKTIQNKLAKQLDKYRADFNRSNPLELLKVVTNLCQFGEDYTTEAYSKGDEVTFETLRMSLIDTDDYTVYGVIGGGIKSHMLYKVHPDYFPNRSRSALWALWYLTDKLTFGCLMDSEFLMIDTKKNTTQQNYFYPYELFSYYAYVIYRLLENKAAELDAYIDESYRYVIVDAFLGFIAYQNEEAINFMISQIREGDYYYA